MVLTMTAAGRENRSVAALLRGLVDQPWGEVSASVYETGRLVSLAPWLGGHDARVRYLLQARRADGGWGAPDGYWLVPTLSATEGLLAAARHRDVDGSAVDRALRLLFRDLPRMRSLPDTPAADLIVPALVEAVNARLDERPDGWWGSGRLGLPDGMSRAALRAVRGCAGTARPLPEKLWHCWEIVGAGRVGQPVPPGTVGGSPAATAAWLGGDTRHPARGYLEVVSGRHGGPVPCTTPITVFERAWVVSGLAGAGVPMRVPDEVVASLSGCLGPAGTPAGPGLPPDADTTAVVLTALARLGLARRPDALWRYDTGECFCTWPGEQGSSTSVNAHVLEALGHSSPDELSAAAMARVTGYLLGQQRADGSWSDRWHAADLYATFSCAAALHRFGGPPARMPVRRAVDWALATQRADGSWGRWGGTAEETAYAVQLLMLARSTPDPGRDDAVARALRYLRGTGGRPPMPALWHDKDLYAPTAIVRAAILAAEHVGSHSGCDVTVEVGPAHC